MILSVQGVPNKRTVRVILSVQGVPKKRTVGVILSDPQCKDSHARFTTVTIRTLKTLV